MSWNFCISGAALAKAGLNRPTLTGTQLDTFSNETEAKICAITRRDWINLSAATLINFAPILDECASSDIAIKIINYDMSGYTSRQEALTMLNVNSDIYNKCIASLNDQKVIDIMHT